MDTAALRVGEADVSDGPERDAFLYTTHALAEERVAIRDMGNVRRQLQGQ